MEELPKARVVSYKCPIFSREEALPKGHRLRRQVRKVIYGYNIVEVDPSGKIRLAFKSRGYKADDSYVGLYQDEILHTQITTTHFQGNSKNIIMAIYSNFTKD